MRRAAGFRIVQDVRDIRSSEINHTDPSEKDRFSLIRIPLYMTARTGRAADNRLPRVYIDLAPKNLSTA
jgi:hypothetical protein